MFLINTVVIALIALSELALAAPLTIPIRQRQTTDPACINGIKRVFMPELFNIYHYVNVEQFPSTSTVLNVMNGSSSGSAQDQVARWSGLPADIKDCTIGWSQAAGRSFSVYDNGLLRFFQLTGLPSRNVTADTIKPFQTADAKGGAMDFTFWPELPGPESHIGGVVDCGSEVIVKVTKDVVNGGSGSVTLQQDTENGLWLEHSC